MESQTSRCRTAGRRAAAALWVLALTTVGIQRVAAARQVTLPLPDFQALRERARLLPAVPAPPPAPFTIERDQVEIVAGPASATVTQRLTVRLLGGDWTTIPLGEAGAWVSADLDGAEGRIDTAGGASSLVLRGAGEHRLRLESAVAVATDEAATRPAWRLALHPPAAAVVVGRLTVAPALAGRVEQAVFEDGGVPRGAPGGGPAGAWDFAALPGRVLRASLLGRAVLPERARLPLRFDATSASSALLSHSRLAVHVFVRARIAQGRLAELRLRLPAGLVVEAVSGAQVAGWKAAAGILTVTLAAPAEDDAAVTMELSGAAADDLTAPLVVPPDAVRTAYLVRAGVQGDGLLELTDPGAARPPDAAETAPLAADSAESPHDAGQGPGASAGAAIGRGRLYLVADAARPPRWHAAWAERTEVLAAQVDRLWVEMAAGEAGRAAYQVWALVRNRGAAGLTLTMPAGFEVATASRDGLPVVPGVTGGGLTVSLATGDAPQLVHLAGLATFRLPAAGNVEVPLPALSAPAARIEMHLLLPGGRRYTLADPTRAAAAPTPPPPPAAPAAPTAGAREDDLAMHLLATAVAAPALEHAGLTLPPPGYVELVAAWSALSASPAPLAVRVAERKESEPWF